MNDKDQSKPVGYAHPSDLKNSQATGTYAHLYPSMRSGEYRTPVYSAEYVESLLGRIESMAQAHIALQQLCEVYRSAYEEARGIVNTPVKLPPLVPENPVSPPSTSSIAHNNAITACAVAIRGAGFKSEATVCGGLTVQED